MTNKMKSILFIAEPRSVYDTMWIKSDEIFSESAKLIDNIGIIKTLLGVDEHFMLVHHQWDQIMKMLL